MLTQGCGGSCPREAQNKFRERIFCRVRAKRGPAKNQEPAAGQPAAGAGRDSQYYLSRPRSRSRSRSRTRPVTTQPMPYGRRPRRCYRARPRRRFFRSRGKYGCRRLGSRSRRPRPRRFFRIPRGSYAINGRGGSSIVRLITSRTLSGNFGGTGTLVPPAAFQFDPSGTYGGAGGSPFTNPQVLNWPEYAAIFTKYRVTGIKVTFQLATGSAQNITIPGISYGGANVGTTATSMTPVGARIIWRQYSTFNYDTSLDDEKCTTWTWTPEHPDLHIYLKPRVPYQVYRSSTSSVATTFRKMPWSDVDFPMCLWGLLISSVAPVGCNWQYHITYSIQWRGQK